MNFLLKIISPSSLPHFSLWAIYHCGNSTIQNSFLGGMVLLIKHQNSSFALKHWLARDASCQSFIPYCAWVISGSCTTCWTRWKGSALRGRGWRRGHGGTALLREGWQNKTLLLLRKVCRSWVLGVQGNEVRICKCASCDLPRSYFRERNVLLSNNV